MLGRLKHVAIAVPDLEAASALYRSVLGAKVSDPVAQPEHGVKVVFVQLPNTKIELMTPLGKGSPIAKFLAKNPDGGLHHICFESADLAGLRDKMEASNMRVLGNGKKIKIGADGQPVLFLHPKDCCGTLIELAQSDKNNKKE